MSEKPIAVLCSDLHFSARAPVARSAEPDWFEAQRRSWSWVGDVADFHGIPIIIAGDIFDRWNAPPEVINFVLRLFDGLKIYAIPGQHDLPNHSYADIERSAYWTLVEAGAMVNIPPYNASGPVNVGGLVLRGFPWGTEIRALEDPCGALVNVAVVHKYVWSGNFKYHGAPDEAHLSKIRGQLQGYDAAIFGDNHKGFHWQGEDLGILNCGGFMARKSDERDYKPCFGLLYEGGSIEMVEMDTSKDKWIDDEDATELIDHLLDATELVKELESLGGDALDFEEAIKQYIVRNTVDGRVKDLINKAVDTGRGDGV